MPIGAPGRGISPVARANRPKSPLVEPREWPPNNQPSLMLPDHFATALDLPLFVGTVESTWHEAPPRFCEPRSIITNVSERCAMRKQLLTLLALTAITAQGAAQQPGQDMQPSVGMMGGMSGCSSEMGGGRMGMMGSRMMMGSMGEGGGMMAMPGHDVMQRAMLLAPGRILENGKALELTPDQVVQIEALAENDADGRAASMELAMAAQQELKDLFDADSPDTAAVRAAAEKAMTMHAGMHAQRIAAAAATRSILSPAQLEQVKLVRGCAMGNKGSGMTMPRGASGDGS